MVVIAICPFCLQETREHIVKTESVKIDTEGTDYGGKGLVYLRCEDCDKAWIEFRHVSDKSRK